DENNDLSSTNVTMGDGSFFDWTFSAGDDYVDVNGEVVVAGGLTIQLVDGGGSSAGADVALFRALDATIVDISQVTVLSPVGETWTWSTDGGGNPVLTFGGEFLVLEGLVTGAAAVPGDTNGDGIVNDADLANFEAQFGGAPGADSADFDGDGDVDAHDFATMRGNWGFGVGPAPLSGDATPEPATMCMLMFGGLGILLRRRSHKA
ncbi:MAG: PEP-CTERM sorting domain-containing protein, partial [Phycisphaerae bacterium]|nr:PEP-CTERM sorting domain-containing protein [Phycisphaerae bacterium]